MPDNFIIRSIKIEDADDIASIQASITKSPAKIDFRQVIEEQVQGDKDASFVAELCRILEFCNHNRIEESEALNQ